MGLADVAWRRISAENEQSMTFDQFIRDLGSLPPRAVVGVQMLLLIVLPGVIYWCYKLLSKRSQSPRTQSIWRFATVLAMVGHFVLGVLSIAIGCIMLFQNGLSGSIPGYDGGSVALIGVAFLVFGWGVRYLREIR